MDVGGGSTEIIAIDGERKHLVSLPIGAVSLSEDFALGDQIAADHWAAALHEIQGYFHHLPWLHSMYGCPIVLLGGAHRALARMLHKPLDSTLVPEIVFRAYQDLLEKNLDERKQISGLEVQRADVIVGGLLPLVILLDDLNIPKIHFSAGGVRQGLIRELIRK